MNKYYRILNLFVLAFAAGCTLANVNVEVLSERTALENQVLGTYNSLDREMLLVASVRGVDARGKLRKPPEHSQEHKDAVTAMQLLSFHADDIQRFKTLGWVGENKEGFLKVFGINRNDGGDENIPEELKEFALRYQDKELETVILQSNEAREVIMGRVIETNENLTKENLPRIRRIFGKLNAENALPGEKIQQEDGTWIEKK